MNLVLPHKGLYDGKTRLSVKLSWAQRYAINHIHLVNTIHVASTANYVRRIFLVTKCEAARAIGSQLGCIVLSSMNESGLSSAVSIGFKEASRTAAHEPILYLPCDLPFLCPFSIKLIHDLCGTTAAPIISPDADYSGVHALCVPRYQPFRFSFGAGSYNYHFQKLRSVYGKIVVFDTPSLRWDLDTYQDLKTIIQLRPQF